MSALEIIPIKGGVRASATPCVNGCKARGSGGRQGTTRAMASHRSFIIGRPAGALCPGCAKEARKVWDGALDTEPERVAA